MGTEGSHRRKRGRFTPAAIGVVVTAALAIGAVAEAGTVFGQSDAAPAAPATLNGQFQAAAQEFHVPVEVLMAVSYQETRWDSHHGEPSMTGNYNVMGLTKVDPSDVAQQSDAGIAAEAKGAAGDDARVIRLAKKHHRPAAQDQAAAPTVNTADPTLHTLDQAASLTHQSADALKTDTWQSIRGGAALLAQYEKSLTGSLPSDAGQWFPAVARYGQSPDSKGASLFAKRVFETIRTGMSRLTADGEQVTLPANPGIQPQGRAATTSAPGTTTGTSTTQAALTTGTTPTVECPATLACDFQPAAYQLTNAADPTSYGNYDIANRPADGIAINYIVIHDTEGTYAGTVSNFKDPSVGTSAHYVVRSSDGHVTQMVPTADEAIHAGNKYFNVHAVGVEHEGYAIDGSWYTESEYQSSAQLVKYLAARFNIPLDRQHIIGHDDVPGPIDSYVSGMHWDPGTYWDWNHYMSLLGAPVAGSAAGAPLAVGEAVTVSIPFTTANEPTVTKCVLDANKNCVWTTIAAQPANFVYLRNAPSPSAALIGDPYLGGTAAGTTHASDWSDKLATGESFVVAGQAGDWTAIWYGGVKAWFYNPRGSLTVPAPAGTVVVSASGASAPVYGRAYPETSAYPSVLSTLAAGSTQQLTSLTKYSIPAGQAYVAYAPVAGDYYYTENINGDAPGDRTLVTGTTTYREIRFNHRVAFVKDADVTVVPSVTPPAASKRWNVVARDTNGAVWQYQGTGNAAAPFLSRYQIASSWNIYNAIVPLNGMRADASSPVIARDTSGVLWWYPGSGKVGAPLGARIRVGGGWQMFNALIGVGDLNRDGKPDLIARDASGTLWFYRGTGNPSAPFLARIKVGGGWQIYNQMVGVGDLNGDGLPDVVARDASGALWLYRGTGNATVPYRARIRIATGWQIYNSIVGVQDVTGDGRADVIARDTSGGLWLFKGTGSTTAPLAARVQIGSSWQIYNNIF